MKIIDDFLIISRINLLSLREGLIAFLLVSVMTPLGMTYVLSLLTDVNTENAINLMCGMIILSASMSVINGIGQSIAQDRLLGRLSLFRTSPVSPISYALGTASTHILITLLNFLILLPAGSLLWNTFPSWRALPTILLAVIMADFSFIGIGAIIGTRVKSTRHANNLTNIISFIMPLMTPAYYPIEMIPAAFRPFFYILPTTPASLIFKGAFSHTVDPVLFLILFVECIFLLFIGYKGIRWREV